MINDKSKKIFCDFNQFKKNYKKKITRNKNTLGANQKVRTEIEMRQQEMKAIPQVLHEKTGQNICNVDKNSPLASDD